MSKAEGSFHSSETVENIIRPAFAGFFFLCMLYCAQKLWKARNTQLTSIKQVFGLCTLFFGIKGLSWMSHLMDTPLFLADLFILWPNFIQVTVAERLASIWLEVYYMFSNSLMKQYLAQRVCLVSIIVNITVHLTFLLAYCILFEIYPDIVNIVLRCFHIAFMVYVIILMTVSVKLISSVIKEFLGSKFSRKIKMIGVFTVITFVISMISNILIIALTPGCIYEFIYSKGNWLAVLLFVEYAMYTLIFMLVIARAIVAQSRDSDAKGYTPAPDENIQVSASQSLDSDLDSNNRDSMKSV
mmetsp:Transcript_25072/g.43978  ORF Transcript_25072/g.43978 Transcript_25072/m.43978 type:complete len:299 (+) Transcript_25072:462-1358(+)